MIKPFEALLFRVKTRIFLLLGLLAFHKRVEICFTHTIPFSSDMLLSTRWLQWLLFLWISVFCAWFLAHMLSEGDLNVRFLAKVWLTQRGWF